MLFTPIKIGALELKNRIVMPAMHTGFAENGYVTERMIHYYEARAKGGVGLIIVEATAVEQQGKTLPVQTMISNDTYVPGLKRLAESIKRHGAKAALQIQHAGIRASAKVTLMQPLSVSGISDLPLDTGLSPRILTIKDIHDLILTFGEAALRAKRAHFDAIEVQCGHSYLVDQFMSPRFNHRRDRFGGSIENRARFACEIIKHTKETVGADYPVVCRISGDDQIEGGITLEDAKMNASLLESAGADCIHVSVGVSANARTAPLMSSPRGCFVHLAEGVKQVVDLPVIAVGRINDPAYAEQILEEQRADLIAMGRALIADPLLPQKAELARIEDITPCISCNQGCIFRLASGLPISCLVNPAVGKEKEFGIEQAEVPKKVLIIGAGPAGMEGARILTLRGHRVILHEKERRLGGQLNLAWVSPHKKEMKRLLDFYRHQMEKLNIEIHLGSEVTINLVKQLKPDVLFMATGVLPNVPNIPGIDKGNVALAVDVIKGEKSAGEEVIVLGSQQVALEAAEFLYDQGKKITLIARASELGLDLHPRLRAGILKRLSETNIKIVTNGVVKEIREESLIVKIEGEDTCIEADTIVFAWGSISNQSLLKEVEELAEDLDIYVGGDCIEPRQALDAIHEASAIARMI